MSLELELPEPDQVIDRLFGTLSDQLLKVGRDGRLHTLLSCIVLAAPSAPAAAMQVTATTAWGPESTVPVGASQNNAVIRLSEVSFASIHVLSKHVRRPTPPQAGQRVPLRAILAWYSTMEIQVCSTWEARLCNCSSAIGWFGAL